MALIACTVNTNYSGTPLKQTSLGPWLRVQDTEALLVGVAMHAWAVEHYKAMHTSDLSLAVWQQERYTMNESVNIMHASWIWRHRQTNIINGFTVQVLVGLGSLSALWNIKMSVNQGVICTDKPLGPYTIIITISKFTIHQGSSYSPDSSLTFVYSALSAEESGNQTIPGPHPMYHCL